MLYIQVMTRKGTEVDQGGFNLQEDAYKALLGSAAAFSQSYSTDLYGVLARRSIWSAELLFDENSRRCIPPKFQKFVSSKYHGRGVDINRVQLDYRYWAEPTATGLLQGHNCEARIFVQPHDPTSFERKMRKVFGERIEELIDMTLNLDVTPEVAECTTYTYPVGIGLLDARSEPPQPRPKTTKIRPDLVFTLATLLDTCRYRDPNDSPSPAELLNSDKKIVARGKEFVMRRLGFASPVVTLPSVSVGSRDIHAG